MGAIDRAEKSRQARELGRKAFLSGKSRESCPYKKSAWGMGYAWDSGWCQAEQENQKLNPSFSRENDNGNE